MRISDWSSDVCSSDLEGKHRQRCGACQTDLQIDPGALGEIVERCNAANGDARRILLGPPQQFDRKQRALPCPRRGFHRLLRVIVENAGDELARSVRAGRKQIALVAGRRSEEHTSELQSLMRISYAAFCLKKKTQQYSN